MAGLKKILEDRGWELGRTLGEGGQARAYVVRRLNFAHEPDFVLKVLSNSKSRQALDRFRLEIDAIQRVSHRAVVRVVDHSEVDDSIQYYIMDYVENARTLAAILGTDENPFHENPVKSLEAFIQICDALKACEAAGIVHRDLSPGNVLLAPDNSIRLIDFGCCQLDDGECITLVDEAVGTPNYRAPECEAFRTRQISIRADLYSAGKLLWSLVSNKRAFARESPVFNDLALKNELPNCPVAWHLHHVFEKTIRHESANRYATAGEAIEESRRILRRMEGGMLPLEVLVGDTCPTCGTGQLMPLTRFWDLQREQGVEGAQFVLSGMRDANHHSICTNCGFAAIRAKDIAAANLKSRKSLT